MSLPVDEKAPIVNRVALVQSRLTTRSSLANGLRILLSVATKLTGRLREFEGNLNSMVTTWKFQARLTPYEQLRRRQYSTSQAIEELQAKIDAARSLLEQERWDHNCAWRVMLELQAEIDAGLGLLELPRENEWSQDFGSEIRLDSLEVAGPSAASRG